MCPPLGIQSRVEFICQQHLSLYKQKPIAAIVQSQCVSQLNLQLLHLRVAISEPLISGSLSLHLYLSSTTQLHRSIQSIESATWSMLSNKGSAKGKNSSSSSRISTTQVDADTTKTMQSALKVMIVGALVVAAGKLWKRIEKPISICLPPNQRPNGARHNSTLNSTKHLTLT